MSRLFGTDGIRGPVFQGLLTPESLTHLGLALGHALGGPHHRALVGMDTRISGPCLKSALAGGLLSAGIDLVDVGVTSTPCVAFLSGELAVDFSLMISASHNPFQDNGLKLFGPKGAKLLRTQEQEIEILVSQPMNYCAPEALGTLYADSAPLTRYTDYLLKSYRGLNLSGLTVALDCAHGSLWSFAAQIFEALGARVLQIGHEPNGININEGVGATHPEALQAFMAKHPADMGFAFDGDGDRVMAFLADGTLLDGDQILAIIAQSWSAEGKLTPQAVVGTVMANHSFKTTLHNGKIDFTPTQVGDKYVVEAMESSGALLGGESSGHIILKPLSATGDGLLTALELVRIHRQVKPLALAFTPCPQILHSVKVQHKDLLNSAQWSRYYQTKMSTLGDDVTCLIRASGTEACIRIMLQGEKLSQLEDLATEFAQKIKECDDATPS